MVDITITNLTASGALAGTEFIPLDIAGPNTRNVTVATLAAFVGSSFQPLDADLTAIAGLTSAADKAPYFTASAAAALFDLSSFVRTITGSANAAAFRTAIGAGTGTGSGSVTSVDVAVTGGSSSGGPVTTSGTITLKVPVTFTIACSDETTALTTGTGKVEFRMPHAMTVTEVRASLTTAQASGSIFTVDINEAGTTIISTKLTIDNTEKTSTTAATPAVISDASLADDAIITIDIDSLGDGTAKGLKITLIGTRT